MGWHGIFKEQIHFESCHVDIFWLLFTLGHIHVLGKISHLTQRMQLIKLQQIASNVGHCLKTLIRI